MLTIFKRTVFDKLEKSFFDARRSNREVDCFLLTHEEFMELRGDARFVRQMDYNITMYTEKNELGFSYTPTRTFELNPKYRGHGRLNPTYRVVADVTRIFGVPFYVLPIEYHTDEGY